MTLTLLFILSTLLISHTGIAFAGLLQRPGNMLDWLPQHIEKIKYPYIRDLFSCMKCVSGQMALWSFIGAVAYSGMWHWFFTPLIGITWICWIIVVTDQVGKWEGYG